LTAGTTPISNISGKENTKKEVPYDKIVKGYKWEDDYVTVEYPDFEAATPQKSKFGRVRRFRLCLIYEFLGFHII
jgi:non-homologous end joining protein Ku